MSDDQNANNDSNNDAGTNDNVNEQQNVSGDPGAANNDAGNAPDTVSREEFNQLFQRMQAADRAKSAAEEELKGLKRKDATELEKAQGDLADVTKERDELREQLRERTLHNAFLSNNKHTWHDPEDALRLLDLTSVQIGDDGKVTGMDSAIEQLAKKKPHLVKKNDDGGNGNGSSAASGSATNGQRKGGKQDPPKDYTSRFPALRGRAPGKS